MATESHSSGNRREDEVRRVVPHASVCRTRELGALQSFGACLVPEPTDCPYSLPAIGGNFCTNPSWKNFLKESTGG